MDKVVYRTKYLHELSQKEMLAAVDCLRADILSGAINFLAIVCDGPSVDYEVRSFAVDEAHHAERLLAAAKATEVAAIDMLHL